MNRVAVVVQRHHESIVGGSEALAWQYASLLKDVYEVELLTTTAIDISEWANVLPEGSELKDGVRLRRFTVSIGRTPYWGKLHDRLVLDYRPLDAQGRRQFGKLKTSRYQRWSPAFQEEFIRTQGPYSASLMEFLKHRWADYWAIIFVTYLYPTTYFGLLQVPTGSALLVPTLHNEAPAYFSVYKHAAHRAHSIIWLTEAEQRLGEDLWGPLAGRVVSMSVDTQLRSPAKASTPYLLYCGRIDPNKGCRQMFDYFIRYKKEFPSELRLVLAGKDDIPVPSHPEIEFRGFVSDEEKFQLMAGARLFIMPSPNESFSIVTMEAMAQRAPVLANGFSDVLADHIRLSGGGRIYSDYRSFAQALGGMLSSDEELAAMGERAREYAISRYTEEDVRDSLLKAVEDCGRNRFISSLNQ
ncbi:MAG TPA: glycosyltransferase family 4 protein [Pyrinomonadaceae bacterium]|jgi:glycosyltransferase involved in cell wall biosynthesis